MANYKKVDSDQLDADLKTVADAIREKGGTTDELAFPDGMATAVSEIQSGGGDTRFKDFVEGASAALDGGDITTIRQYGFYYSSSTRANFPNVTSVGERAFYHSSVEEVSMPKVQTLANNSFRQCYSLAFADFPSLETIEQGAFGECSKLTNVFMPKLRTAAGDVFYVCDLRDVSFPLIEGVPSFFLYSNKNMSIADFAKATTIATNAFGSCYSLVVLALRSESVCTLENTSAFNGCCHILGTTATDYSTNIKHNPDKLKDGYIYVPRALIEDYKVATNWTTFADQFRALEDYTVDGTTTGAMDWDKINGGAA